MARRRLQDELKKKGPFESPQQEAMLNLLRTHDRLQICLERLFRTRGLTSSQYNVLRILRGEGRPLPILEIAGRTVTVVPGITGLIDRLERAGLVRRERSAQDRRVVFVDITPQARALLAGLDAPLMQLHRDLLGHLSDKELRTLIRLLEKARCRAPQQSPTDSPDG
jgi:DNA-binding MarR family transcriptional regulator